MEEVALNCSQTICSVEFRKIHKMCRDSTWIGLRHLPLQPFLNKITSLVQII